MSEPSLEAYQEFDGLYLWNETRSDFPKEKSIHKLFEEMVEQIPESTAIIYEEQHISYRILNERANQLAHSIRALGIKREDRVGVALPRGIELIVGLFAILKAGAAYVPLDITYPEDRLAYMLEDSGVKLVLSLRIVNLPKTYLGNVLYLEDEGTYNAHSISNLDIPLSSENLAYVTYTSGSTGRPKGVACHHKSVINRLYWAWNNYRFKKEETCCLQSSISFVDSTWDIFGTLLAGAKLVLYKESISKNIEELLDCCLAYKITRITLIPSFLNTMLDFSREKLNAYTKHLTHWEITGESFKPNLIDNFFKYVGEGHTLLDCYGATEATSVIYRDYHGKKGSSYQTKIISNTEVYLLDAKLNLVQRGEEGEIYIGGVELARGYLNLPGLTAEKFIPNPFLKGDRLYKTGDLARFLPDGNIEFLGRIDQQLKLRGFRVELGEIEKTIEIDERVQQAIVLCREDIPEQKRLVAYLVRRRREDIKTETGDTLLNSLQNLCRDRLPDYMLPSLWVILDALPLTPNGKIDRKALPVPKGKMGRDDYQAPVGRIEEQLAGIWSELLGLEIGRNDDFFRLGGHSLLVTQMVSRLRKTLKLEVPLKAVFEHSILFDLARYIEQSYLEKDALPAIVTVSRDKPQPLSFAQQRLWFIEQLLPNTDLYHISIKFKILGQLNLDALRAALNSVAVRHEILRTVIINSDGIAEQKILPLDIGFQFVNCQGNLEDEDTKALVKKPFQIATEPLCRGILIKNLQEDHMLIFVFHHMVIDDWSIEIFFKELNVFYNVELNNNGKNSILPALAAHYVDYSVWQRTWLQGEILEKQLKYWQKQLHEISSLELPTDYPRPKELSYQGGSIERKLPQELLDELRFFASTQGVTVFMCILASIQGFLSRYCNQKDIVIGTPIANRRSAELEGVIGFFVNTLVIRNYVDEHSNFETLTKQVKDTTILAYEHQDVPFEQLVDYLQVPRELNRNPLFQVMFNLQQEEEMLELGDCKLVREKNLEQLSRFDLLISAIIGKEGINIRLDYAKDLFKEIRIECLAEYYETFLRVVLKEPSKRIWDVSILGEEEQQALSHWNNTHQEHQDHKNVAQLFEDQVRETPLNIAVLYEDLEITYQELNEKANQLAHFLRKKGVGADKLVAVALERSIEMVVSILAILKAGGAYVPIDPFYPEQRLMFMIDDTQAPLLITHSSLKEIFTGYDKLIYIDGDWQEIQKENSFNPGSITRPEHLAYIIYTSGSTGTPKGVMISHRNLRHYIHFAKKTYPIRQGKSLFHGSFSFDMSITALFLPLVKGSAVCMVSKIIDIESLGEFIKKHQDLNLIKLTPTHLKALKEQLNESVIKQQKATLIIGGEKLSGENIENWMSAFEGTIVNEYGPTEATVGCCIFPIENLTKEIPIGRPIDNTTIYLLNEALEMLPIGAIGEIFIGGEGLARGYWNRPDLTAERFVPNPFESGTRLYKTGDLARYLPSGDIEYLGRMDDQIKIKGFRIEPGEIIAALLEHQDVLQAVVVAKEEASGVKKLIAYVVPGEFSPSSTELREHLEQLLPPFMIPSFFVLIDEIPFTLNGKLDQRALPSPESFARDLQQELILPRTERERTLWDIWKAVLGVEQLGVRDHFFRIGGDSIISIQLVSKARQKGIKLSVKDVFNCPTIEALAIISEENDHRGQKEKLQAEQIDISCQSELDYRQRLFASESFKLINKNDLVVEDAYPLSPLQAGLLFQNLYQPGSDAYFVQSVLKLEGKINNEALQTAWQIVCDHHVILKTGIAWEGLDKPLQYVVSKAHVPFELLKWTNLKNEDLEVNLDICLDEDRQQGFDLRRAPLFRVKLIDCGNVAYMIWSSHHIISDGWSTPIILADVLRIYDSLITGNEILLKNRVPYKEYINWLEKQDKETSRVYWQTTLDSVAGPTTLSFRKLRQNISAPKDYGTHEVELSLEETSALQRFASEMGITLNTVLQGALGLLLQHYTQKSDVIMGVTVSGRTIELAGIEDMVGLFINTLPLKISCLPRDSVKTYLNALQQKTLELNEFSYSSLSEIYSWVSQHQGLFDVLFVFENYPVERIAKQGSSSLKITNIKTVERTEYPLTVIVVMEDRVNFIFRYQTEHFDESTIARTAIHLRTLLANMQKSNDNPRNLGYLASHEFQQIIRYWNKAYRKLNTETCIQQLFEEQVNRTPHKIALIYENEEMTYQELNMRANQLAHYLRELGVGPDRLVAIALERSLNLLIGLLGILKAGGAYVPLDPSYPRERQRFMLEDTNACLLITHKNLSKNFAGIADKILIIDESQNEIEKKSKNNPLPSNLQQHLAYVIYTSGSTGKPKGAMITHEGLLNRLLWMKERYHLTDRDSVLQKTPFTFDVSVWELFLPLLSGATEVIASPGIHKDPHLIWNLITERSVTICHFVPPMLKAFLGSREEFRNNPLRVTVTSGDILSEDIVQEFYTKLSSELYNLYGPTEASIDVTEYACHEDLHATPPIGKPIWNTQIYILDDMLNPVPVGVSGELYIGGVGLARGYLNRPALTAEKFIPNPFIENHGEDSIQHLRLYRTGDLARYLPCGNIEFLGRRDDQLKIRGYRIELGEIEAVITRYEKVRQSVVIAIEDELKRKKLVAYIVPLLESCKMLIEEVREYLNAVLPEYMIPSVFILISEIPITSNGKVDRKALPSPDSSSEILNTEYQLPQNEIERELCEVWRIVLGIDRVGIKDHFFRLGGDSIISIQLVAKARQRGIIFSVKDVFNNPTIETLARVAYKKNDYESLGAKESSIHGVVPLTPIQYWFFGQNPANIHYFNQVMWFKTDTSIDLNQLQNALKSIYQHHDSFRLRYRQKEEGFEQYYAEETSLPWNVYEDYQVDSLERVCNKLQSSLNIEHGPLSQLLWVEEKQQLLWIIHHLIVDGVSWRILLDDLNLALRGEDLGQKSNSFKDWGLSLAEYSNTREVDYYNALLKTIPRIPRDNEYYGNVTLKDTQENIITFSAEITKLFLTKAHHSYGTEPNDLLLLALLLAIGDCFGKYQLCVDLEGHGREDLGNSLDLTRTVGWFTSMYPVVLILPDPSDLGQCIKRVKEHLRTVPKKGVSYGILSQIQHKCAQIQGDILFNYLGQWSNTERQNETFYFVEDEAGISSSLNNFLSHPIIINGGVNSMQLSFHCTYSTLHFNPTTMDKLMQRFQERLEVLVRYCTEESHYGFSPSDFPLVKLKAKQLDKLLEKIGSKSNG